MEPVCTRIGDFRWHVRGNSGLEMVLEVADDLQAANWIPLKTNPVGQVGVEFIDLGSTSRSNRFYRVIER